MKNIFPRLIFKTIFATAKSKNSNYILFPYKIISYEKEIGCDDDF
jgi:hypothetical protein